MTDGSMSFVIHKGMTYPCHSIQKYTNSRDKQTEFSIEIFEGNNPLAKENKSIKEYTVAMRPCPRGQALIEIKFDINDQGILTFEHTVKNDQPVEKGTVFANIGVEMEDGMMGVLIPKSPSEDMNLV